MYNWRKMTDNQREEVLSRRRLNHRPWHSPLHVQGDKTRFHITAACYEHLPIIGKTVQRMAEFEKDILEVANANVKVLHCWCVLPNHYHLLVTTEDIFDLLSRLGKLHGRTSYCWNGDDSMRGRQVWCNSAEHGIKSDRHFWATVNYVHHNPVKHAYADRWLEWPFSSAHDYLKSIGRDKAVRNWREYPIDEMGKDWDGN